MPRHAPALLLIIAVTAALTAAGCSSEAVETDSRQTTEQSEDTHESTDIPTRIRSVTFSSRRAPDSGTLESLRDLGVSHVTLITFGYQGATDETTVRFDPHRRWYTESDSGIVELAKAAEHLHIRTILKPHLWIGGHGRSGQRRDLIGFKTEAEWTAWESSYRKFILHYASLAQQIHADIFVIGTELATAARERPGFWRSLAEEIRTVYDGKLTYAANWYAEYEHIEFWETLDFVGVQAYFPLSRADRPTLATLRRGWQEHIAALRAISIRTHRPVFFTELGYQSVSDAAREPWRWVTREEALRDKPDMELQADLYRAFFEELWPRKWFAGASLWRWHNASETDGPLREIDFTPQGKPSLAVIGNWYTQDLRRDQRRHEHDRSEQGSPEQGSRIHDRGPQALSP